MGSSLSYGSLFSVLFIRVPCYVGDPKRDPHLENYPYVEFPVVCDSVLGLSDTKAADLGFRV